MITADEARNQAKANKNKNFDKMFQFAIEIIDSSIKNEIKLGHNQLVLLLNDLADSIYTDTFPPITVMDKVKEEVEKNGFNVKFGCLNEDKEINKDSTIEITW